MPAAGLRARAAADVWSIDGAVGGGDGNTPVQQRRAGGDYPRRARQSTRTRASASQVIEPSGPAVLLKKVIYRAVYDGQTAPAANACN